MGQRTVNMWKSSFKAMGTEVEVLIGPTDVVADEQIELAYKEVIATVDRLESKFSRFRKDSELSQLNANAGVWMNVSLEMASVLRLASEAYAATGGLFDPCLGKVMQEVGYSDSFERIKTNITFDVGESALTNQPVVIPPLHGHELRYLISPKFDKVYLFPGYEIDLGGIAKGWISEQAGKCLQEHGISDFVVSAGGDMVCRGRNGDRAWQVGVTNPWNFNERMLTLNVEESSVATSGTYKRQWVQGTEHRHHIIQPMSGKPAQTDVVSCTVVAQSIVAAEVWAKTCLILGSENGPKWLSNKNQLGWVIVREDGSLLHAWQ